MSTLAATYLKDRVATPTLPITSVIKGVPKVWFMASQVGTQSLPVSFNSTSITDNGVGDSTVVFTAALVGTNHAAAGQCPGGEYWAIAYATGSHRLGAKNSSGAFIDTYPTVMICGDLA